MRQTDDPVAPTDAQLRRRLTALGKRREKLRKKDEELAEAIREVIPDVRVSKAIPMEEAAKRLGLNRTTIYQVYLDDDKTRARATV